MLVVMICGEVTYAVEIPRIFRLDDRISLLQTA